MPPSSTHFASIFAAGVLTGATLLYFSMLVSKRSKEETAKAHQDLILGRRTILEFEPELPSDWEAVLHKALQAAIYAPNHRRTEPWRFHLLGKDTIQRVCELNTKIVASKSGEAAAQKKLKRWLSMPGWLVVTCRRTDKDTFDDPKGQSREDYAACCCAIQNMSLSFHAQGYGTKWSTGGVNFHPDFSSTVGFNPDEEYVIGTIWFGKPSSVPKPPVKKLTVADILLKHA